MRWAGKEKKCMRAKNGLICGPWRDSNLLSSNVATLGDRERDGAGGTCRGALAKSPIITSKLDSGGGLSGTGSLQRMKHYRDSSKKKSSSSCQIFSLSYPPAPLAVPHFLSHLPCSTFFLPSSPFINSSLCLISTFNTWMERKHPFSFPSPPNEFLHPPWLRQGPRTGGPGEPHL